jgi:hypothetical protein
VESIWTGLVDDAAIFPPGDAPLDVAVAAYDDRTGEPWSALVASLVCRDTDLPALEGQRPLSVVVTGGAGAIAGPMGLAARRDLRVHALEIALRDPDDLPGNARRVIAALDAARSEGVLADDLPVFVELPQAAPTAGWLAAADEVATAELRLKLRTGGVAADLHPGATTLAAWIDAALDRETPFKCTAGLHHAVRHTSAEGFEQHGFLNVLLATHRAFEGASPQEVVETLEERVPAPLVEDPAALAAGRRWFTSFGSCSVSDPRDDLTALGLLEQR